MLTQLGEKLQGVFKKIKGYGKLTDDNISDALREVRKALLAADVNYQVAKKFCDRVKEKAVGEEVAKSIRPGDLFVKIVHDEMIETFSRGTVELSDSRPLSLLLCGLNGAGKTTTAGKLAMHLKKEGEKVYLVAADLTRPAAVQQLQTLGKQIDVPVIAPEEGQKDVVRHVQRGRALAAEGGATVVIYDTAGRTEVSDELLKELQDVHDFLRPREALLVADAATGQAAVEVAEAFSGRVNLTGLVLSKFDGDTRGGAALSLQTVTECPIKFIGTGEKIEALEVFHPDRLVNRLLGMGDIVSLVEKAQEEIDVGDAMAMQEKLMKNQFDLEDFLNQLRQLKKLGPLQNLLGMLPGMGRIHSSSFDEKALGRTEAIICSMTPKERRRPEILNARRRQRIASGSGTAVRDVNELLRRFKQMKKMMGKFVRGAKDEKKLKRLMGQFAP